MMSRPKITWRGKYAYVNYLFIGYVESDPTNLAFPFYYGSIFKDDPKIPARNEAEAKKKVEDSFYRWFGGIVMEEN